MGRPASRSHFVPQVLFGLMLAFATLGLTACHSAQYYYYKFPASTYAGRPVPPSKLAQRVMIGYSFNGSSGSLAIVDGSRDIRTNVEDTIPSFSISGYSSGYPSTIINYPAEVRGYVYSSSDGSLVNINYSTEASAGSVGTFESGPSAFAIPPAASHYYAAEEANGVLEVVDNISGGNYSLIVPNVFKVFVNTGDTVALAMVRNANLVYRIFKLNQAQYANNQLAIAATGSVDCEPFLNPVYCAVAVPGTYDEPNGVYFSLDGTTAYVLNCGPECGGTHRQRLRPPAGPAQRERHPLIARAAQPPDRQRARSRRRHRCTLRRRHPLPRRPAAPARRPVRRLPLHHEPDHQHHHRQVFHLRWQPLQDALRR